MYRYEFFYHGKNYNKEMKVKAVLMNEKFANCSSFLLENGFSDLSNVVYGIKDIPVIQLMRDSDSVKVNYKFNLLLNDKPNVIEEFPVQELLSNNMLAALTWEGFKGPVKAHVVQVNMFDRIIILTVNIGTTPSTIAIMGKEDDVDFWILSYLRW